MATLASGQFAPPMLPLRIVALVTGAMFLNYVDRGSLSVVAPVLSKQFAIDSARMGILLSSFYWTYAQAQPFAGWLARRQDVRRVLTIGVAI
jgi:MFS family permease